MTENDVGHSLWEPLPGIPNAFDDFRGYAMASARDIVYVSGGSSISNNAVVHNKSLLSFDMSTRKWSTLPDMVHERRGHGLAVLEGGRYLFAIGGRGVGKSNSNAGEPGWGREAARRRMSLAKTSCRTTELAKSEIERLGSYEIYDVSKRLWKVAGTLNESRSDFAMTVDPISGKVYVFGGRGASGGALATAEAYDPHAHAWRSLAPMPRPCQRCHALLRAGNCIHVFEAGRTTLTYDAALDMWSEAPPDESCVPMCPRRGHVCSSCSSRSDGAAIVYGYVVAEAEGHLTSRWMISHIARKNKRSKSWTMLPPADAFSYHRTAVANGKLVVAVGSSLLAFQVADDAIDDGSAVSATSSCSSSVSTFDESPLCSSRMNGREVESIEDDGAWKLQPQIFSKPPGFRGYAVASAGNKVYISGGFSGDGFIHRSFLSYNNKKKKWKNLPSMTHHRIGHQMVVSPDGCRIYTLGGGDGKTTRRLGIEIYNIKRRSWNAGPAMNSYRVFFGATFCLGKLLVFGGVGSKDGDELGSVESFDPRTKSWRYERPMPEVRGVCNAIAIGRIVHVFGIPSQRVLTYDAATGEWLDSDDAPPSSALPEIPPGGCVCASSSHSGGEVLVTKHPLGDRNPTVQRRTAHVYDASKKAWSSVRLLDDFACYGAVLANNEIVVVTPQSQLMAHAIPKISG